jgi:hypothetical protein
MVNFVIVPKEVTNLLTGHSVRLLPPPQGGGGAVVSYWHDFGEWRIPNRVRHLREVDALRVRAAEMAGFELKAQSCARLHFERYPLSYRVVDPATGKVVKEVVLSEKAKAEMRLRGPRKQVAARAVVQRNARDDQWFYIPSQVEDVEGNWELNKTAYGVFQGYRQTDFKAGERSSGDVQEAKRVKLERAKVDPSPSPEDPLMRELKDLERQIRKLMGQ